MNYKTTNLGQTQNKNNKSNQQCLMGRSMIRILMAAILLAVAMPATAQVRLGFKAGTTVNEMRLSRNVATATTAWATPEALPSISKCPSSASVLRLEPCILTVTATLLTTTRFTNVITLTSRFT